MSEKTKTEFKIVQPKSVWSLVFFIGWVAGVVIAKGFWSTLFAVLLFPWSWYILIEKVLIANGLL